LDGARSPLTLPWPQPVLLPSLGLLRRIVDAETAYTLSPLRVLEGLPGNPIGVACRQVDDGVVALMARHLPVPSFNSVIGLRGGHAHHIAPLVEWYRDHRVNGRFEMVPGNYDATLGRELARLGYYQSGFHVAMIGEPDPSAAAAHGAVERVADAVLMEGYLDAYVAGWGIPPGDRERFKQNVRPWRDQPGWSLCLARTDGRPGAAATLFIHAKVGYLADGATDLAHRGRGLHAALLRRRIADATAAGVDFVCGGAEFLSASHRNMERAGLRVAFMRSIWTAG
jgi:GNAT superfamily N-acetyltransferase